MFKHMYVNLFGALKQEIVAKTRNARICNNYWLTSYTQNRIGNAAIRAEYTKPYYVLMSHIRTV